VGRVFTRDVTLFIILQLAALRPTVDVGIRLPNARPKPRLSCANLPSGSSI